MHTVYLIISLRYFAKALPAPVPSVAAVHRVILLGEGDPAEVVDLAVAVRRLATAHADPLDAVVAELVKQLPEPGSVHVLPKPADEERAALPFAAQDLDGALCLGQLHVVEPLRHWPEAGVDGDGASSLKTSLLEAYALYALS